jgi:[acyl-carrier-protein] S-malonyltransferase
MAADGATEFVELGPGKVLQGLVKRTVSGVATRGVDTYKDFSGS